MTIASLLYRVSAKMERPDGYLTISHLGTAKKRDIAVYEILLMLLGIAGVVAAYGF